MKLRNQSCQLILGHYTFIRHISVDDLFCPIYITTKKVYLDDEMFLSSWGENLTLVMKNKVK